MSGNYPNDIIIENSQNTKGLLKDFDDLQVGGLVETIQITALLKTARILKRVLET